MAPQSSALWNSGNRFALNALEERPTNPMTCLPAFRRPWEKGMIEETGKLEEGADELEISDELAFKLDYTGPGNDWFLQRMVAMANDGLSVGITLAINGQVISGTLISVAEYFRQYADSFLGAKGADGTPNEAHAAIAGLGDRAVVVRKGVPVPPNYIHLKDARYVTPGGVMPANNMLWRGKINGVTGWSLGTFHPQE